MNTSDDDPDVVWNQERGGWDIVKEQHERESARVVRNEERDGWDVVTENDEGASAHFDTQAEAIAHAKEALGGSGLGDGDARMQD